MESETKVIVSIDKITNTQESIIFTIGETNLHVAHMHLMTISRYGVSAWMAAQDVKRDDNLQLPISVLKPGSRILTDIGSVEILKHV